MQKVTYRQLVIQHDVFQQNDAQYEINEYIQLILGMLIAICSKVESLHRNMVTYNCCTAIPDVVCHLEGAYHVTSI